MAYIAEIHDLKKYYGGALALDIPELCIGEGERLAIIGANGSGKTTLLRILAGVLPFDEGEVLVRTDSVGYMPQKPYAFGYTVRKNVELAVRDKTQRAARAEDALQKVGLSALSEHRGSDLSGGESQRMAFARMLAMEARLLLMDEPTAAADIEAGELLERTLEDYLRASGASIVFSTHVPSQALKLAENIILLDGGKIAERGTAERVLHSPESESARRFLSHWRL